MSFRISIVFLVLLHFALPASAEPAQKNILFIYGDKSTGLATLFRDTAVATLRAGSADRINVQEEFTDLSQFTAPEYQKLLSNFFRSKYSGRNIDLIIATSPGVLRFLLDNNDSIFPSVPVVFGVVDQIFFPGLQKDLKANFAGILMNVGYGATLDAALKIQPDVKHVVVIGGTSSFDAQYLAKARREISRFEGQVELTYLTTLTMEELEERVANLPGRSIVLFVNLLRDGSGEAFAQIDAVHRIASASRVPVYSIVERYIEGGAIGGFGWSIESEAREVSKVGLRVLAGEKPSDIPIKIADTNRYAFDSRQLQRLGIPESNLPDGSILLHAEPGLWDRYKWRILAVSALCLLQAILIVSLLMTLKRRQQDIRERANAERSLHNLSGRLLKLQDMEQRRIAAELHDGIGQSLAIISNRALMSLSDTENHERVREHLNEISATARAGVNEIREIAYNLRPYELDRLGLVAAIESMIERVSDSTSMVISLKLDPIEGLLSSEAETSVYRVVQEGLNNVLKHSQGTTALIELKRNGRHISISIQDNGIGFSQTDTTRAGQSNGFGLAGIAERVRSLGGSLAVDSHPHLGTTLTVLLELPEEASPSNQH